MKETQVIFNSKPELKDPIVIEGLPGIGLVGKIAVDHLLSKKKTTPFCEIYSPYFPPQVITDKKGIVHQVKNEFHHFNENGQDFIIIAGDFQGMTPESQYEIAGKILDVLEEFKPKVIYTLGGLGIGKVVKRPAVFAAANNAKLIESHKEFKLKFTGREGGGIFGASGLLLGLGALRELDGVCLMAETLGQVVDAKAAKVLLEKLSKVVGIEVDMRDLKKKAKKTEEELSKIKQMQDEQEHALQMALAGGQVSSDEDVDRYIR